MAPWGPADASFAPSAPWPAIAIGIGRTAMPALRKVRRCAGLATFTVALQDPRTTGRIADLIWVPEHDRRRGSNVVSTLTPPNRFTPALLAALRSASDSRIDDLSGPRVMLALGGTSKAWRWTSGDIDKLVAALCVLGQGGVSFLATASRRTPPALTSAVTAALRPFPHVVYAGEGDNPYPRFLAKADAVVVTADSVSMTGEACATGRPVFVFRPSGGSAKFERFHDALSAAGATVPLTAATAPDLLAHLGKPWQALQAAGAIARVIEERWMNRARYLGPLMGQEDGPRGGDG